jgi:cytoplasmic iron level regulating protein YaaA (DUF328/UPF0246 family)
MLLLLSPAKTLDYESPLPDPVQAARAALKPAATAPQYAARAAELIGVLRQQSVADIAGLMDLSDDLARLNVTRYKTWSTRATEKNSRPAMWAFNGDVYDGLQAATLSADDIAWAQQHLLMLSGLYGVLRPLDRLQPYRLERAPASRPIVALRCTLSGATPWPPTSTSSRLASASRWWSTWRRRSTSR